jgi:hypothetical protein
MSIGAEIQAGKRRCRNTHNLVMSCLVAAYLTANVYAIVKVRIQAAAACSRLSASGQTTFPELRWLETRVGDYGHIGRDPGWAYFEPGGTTPFMRRYSTICP